MKKIAIIIAVMACCQLASADQLKVYINPGHGGWNEVNDRHIATISYPARNAKGETDTLGFWESSSNLKVAFDLEEMLLKAGAKVQMSRRTNQSGFRDNGELDWDGVYIGHVKNGYTGQVKDSITSKMEGDRPFAIIKEEASAMGADILLSIHSNAAGSVGAAANYVALFLPGTVGDWVYQKGATTEESVKYAKAIYMRMRHNPLDCFTEGGETEADTKWWTFTTEYSLLNGGCTCPIDLCEASFHSYMPNTHRYLNRDYQWLEAVRFYYAFCDIWKLPFHENAIFCGDVRDGNMRMAHKTYLNYIARSKDQWTPLNGASVKLYQNNTLVDTYITDNNYNGLFCFRDVKPGEYTVIIDAKEYVSDTFNVTLTAGETTTVNRLLTDSLHITPLDPNYPEYAENANFPSAISFNYQKEISTNFIDGLNIRRMLFRDGKAYILTDESEIYVVSMYNGQQIGKLSTNGVSGGIRTLSDIAFTSEGMLVACNKELVTATNGKKMKLYSWADDNADPELVYTIDKTCDIAEAEIGESMVISDNIWHSKIYVSVVDAKSDPREVKILGIEWANTKYVKGVLRDIYVENAATYTEEAWGADFKFFLSPIDINRIIVDGSATVPTEYTFDWTSGNGLSMEKNGGMTTKMVQKVAYGTSYFRYAMHPLMVLPVCDKNLTNVGVEIYDLTNGLPKATQVASKMPASGLGTNATTFMASGVNVDENDLITIAIYAKGEGMMLFSQKPIADKVENSTLSIIRAFGENGQLRITNAEGQRVVVYNAAGQMLMNTMADSDNFTTNLNGNQVVFIKVGNTAHKVRL